MYQRYGGQLPQYIIILKTTNKKTCRTTVPGTIVDLMTGTLITHSASSADNRHKWNLQKKIIIMITTECPLQQRWCEYRACIALTVCCLCPRTALSFLPRLYFGCYVLSHSSGFLGRFSKWNSAVFSERSSCSQFLIVATRRCLLPSSFPFLLCFFTLMLWYIDPLYSIIIRRHITLVMSIRAQQIRNQHHHFLTVVNIWISI